MSSITPLPRKRAPDPPYLHLCNHSTASEKHPRFCGGGSDLCLAATDLRTGSGVNRLHIEKISARNSPGESKLKVMKEIAKECQVEWELLKPLEQRIEGPQTFVSVSNIPVKPTIYQTTEPRSA